MSTIQFPTQELFQLMLEATALEEYGLDSINEVKTWDKPHGAKLAHSELDAFFKNVAPKYDTLDQVEAALHALYKKNSIETSTQGIKQVVSNYKKRVNFAQQNESIETDNAKELTTEQKRKREAIVKSMKKNFAKFKKKYGDNAEAMMYAAATTLAKK